MPGQHARWRSFEGAPEASWKFVGTSWEASRGLVVRSFEASRVFSEASWGILGASSGRRVDLLVCVPALGPLLGPSGGYLGLSWAPLSPFTGPLGPSWDPLRGLSGRLGLLGAHGAILERRKLKKAIM